MILGLADDKSTLVQVMAWCRQTTSHYLSQCWPSSMSPYGVTRPEWVNNGESHHDLDTLSTSLALPLEIQHSLVDSQLCETFIFHLILLLAWTSCWTKSGVASKIRHLNYAHEIFFPYECFTHQNIQRLPVPMNRLRPDKKGKYFANIFYFDLNFTEMCSYESSRQ